MNITNVLTGTISLEPGASMSRNIDIVSGIPGVPVFVLSRVIPSDPANNILFKFTGINGPNTPAGDSDSSRLSYVGAKQISLFYDLTGSDAIDVDFYILWADEFPASVTSYGGI